MNKSAVLENVSIFLPLMLRMFQDPANLTLTDSDSFEVISKAEHPQFKNPSKIGDKPLPQEWKNSPTYQKLKSGQTATTRFPKGTYGYDTPWVCTTVPVNDPDANQFIAFISVSISSEKMDNLINSGQDLLASVQEIYAATEDLAGKGNILSEAAKIINGKTSELAIQIKDIGSISDEIKEIAASTKILGINAAIESARTGELGRGFSVVADEVRKLAEDTNSSVKSISLRINNVNQSVNEIIEKITVALH